MISILFEDTLNGSVETLIQELNNLPITKGINALTWEDIKPYEDILDRLPNGTKLSLKTTAGTNTYEKINGMDWEKCDAPWYDITSTTNFTVAQWLAGRGNIARGDIELVK